MIATMLLIWGGVAFGARTGSPPAGAFSGHYKVTIKVTNIKSTPSHWIYGVQPRCSSLCHAVAFRPRLVSEKSWRNTVLAYRWNGKAYVFSKKLPQSDCVGKSGSTVKNGYNVTGRFSFQVRAVTKGRVTRWSGTGKESYMPNAAGRKHHCKWGAYDYTQKAVAQ